jgi:hypothetical protein
LLPKNLVKTYGIFFLLFIILFLHIAVISFPSHDTVFDEVYYLQSARDSNNLNATNLEHTPLSKILYGVSILTIGENALGWRIVPVICSVLSILFIYLISKNFMSPRKALFVSSLLAFETLFFVNTSIAILESPAIMFSLLGFYMFLTKYNKLSAVVFGLAFLCKETTILIPIALMIYTTTSSLTFKKYLKPLLGYTLIIFSLLFITTSVVGLAIYDQVYHPTLPSGHVLSNGVDNILYITSYFGQTTQRDWSEVAIHRPAWTWTLPFPETFHPPMYRDVTVYHRVQVGGEPGITVTSEVVFFKVEWFSMQSLPIALMFFPIIIICLWNIKRKVKVSYSLLSLSLLLTTWTPWLLLGTKALFNYYFVLTIPFICFSMPLLWDTVKNDKVRHSLMAIQFILVLVFFIYYFPINLLRG